MRKNISVNMVYTRSNEGQETEEKQTNQKSMPVTEIDLETPEQSLDGEEQKATDSTPMPNEQDQEQRQLSSHR